MFRRKHNKPKKKQKKMSLGVPGTWLATFSARFEEFFNYVLYGLPYKHKFNSEIIQFES